MNEEDLIEDELKMTSQRPQTSIANAKRPLSSKRSERMTQLMNENKVLKKKETDMIKVINKYRKEVDHIEKEGREIRSFNAAEGMKNIELREFFLSCISEIKRATVKHNTALDNYRITKPASAKPQSQRILSMEFRETPKHSIKGSKEKEKE